MKEQIETWINNALKRLDENSYFESIHIDELGETIEDSPGELFSKAIDIFNQFCESISKESLKDMQLFLQISLQESVKMQGVLANKEELLKCIDTFEMPEIILYKPYNTLDIPNNEFYRSPLPFKVEGLSKELNAFYKEYRNYDEMINNEPFTREINVVYL